MSVKNSIIVWSQKEGFFSVEKDLGWGAVPGGEDEDKWLERISATHQETFGTECGDQLKFFTFSEHKEYWGFCLIDSYAKDEQIFVRTKADMVALRLLLAPPLICSMDSRLDSLESLAETAYRLWHGHERTSFCARCEPEAWRRHQAKIAGSL